MKIKEGISSVWKNNIVRSTLFIGVLSAIYYFLLGRTVEPSSLDCSGNVTTTGKMFAESLKVVGSLIAGAFIYYTFVFGSKIRIPSIKSLCDVRRLTSVESDFKSKMGRYKFLIWLTDEDTVIGFTFILFLSFWAIGVCYVGDYYDKLYPKQCVVNPLVNLFNYSIIVFGSLVASVALGVLLCRLYRTYWSKYFSNLIKRPEFPFEEVTFDMNYFMNDHHFKVEFMDYINRGRTDFKLQYVFYDKSLGFNEHGIIHYEDRSKDGVTIQLFKPTRYDIDQTDVLELRIVEGVKIAEAVRSVFTYHDRIEKLTQKSN